MVKVKAGVTPRLIVLVAAVANEAANYRLTATITAGTNGTHKIGSKHYTGDAIDVRSKNFVNRAMREAFLASLRTRLGTDYDCLFEGAGTVNEHFHLEYDPKGNR